MSKLLRAGITQFAAKMRLAVDWPLETRVVERNEGKISSATQDLGSHFCTNPLNLNLHVPSNVSQLCRAGITQSVVKKCRAVEWPLETRVVERNEGKIFSTTQDLSSHFCANPLNLNLHVPSNVPRLCRAGITQSVVKNALQWNGHWKPELLRETRAKIFSTTQDLSSHFCTNLLNSC